MSLQWLGRVARVIGANAFVYAYLRGMQAVPGILGSTVVLGLVLIVLGLAIRLGRMVSVTAAVTAAIGYGIWFVEPVGKPNIDTFEGWVTVFALLIAAVGVSQLALQGRLREREALARQRETERLYELGQSLVRTPSSESFSWTVVNQAVTAFSAKGAALLLESGEVRRAGDSEQIPESVLKDCLRAQRPYFDHEGQLQAVPVQRDGLPYAALALLGGGLTDAGMRTLGQMVGNLAERLRISDSLARSNIDLEKQNQEVIEQRRVAESLLLNILPEEVAQELRQSGSVSPRYFEDVTILFTDFVGFTLSTEHLAAEDVVVLLHEYFTAFDRICERYGLEKLKTIGDSYMCIAGLPVRTPSHPVDAVMAAFEMVHEVERRARELPQAGWRVRIGLHSGPVVAGVVGINKFAFDIWGDTVNYSSRMESSGQPNRINISERTYGRVKDFFECEPRGKVLTKDKREVDMFFVNRALPRLMEGAAGGVPPAFERRYRIYFQKAPPAFPEFLHALVNSEG